LAETKCGRDDSPAGTILSIVTGCTGGLGTDSLASRAEAVSRTDAFVRESCSVSATRGDDSFAIMFWIVIGGTAGLEAFSVPSPAEAVSRTGDVVSDASEVVAKRRVDSLAGIILSIVSGGTAGLGVLGPVSSANAVT